MASLTPTKPSAHPAASDPETSPPARPAPPAWRARLTPNPVMQKELRGRMRGSRAFVLITFHLLALSGFVLLLYSLYQASTESAFNRLSAQLLGKYLFGGIVGLELLLAVFITPAVTASAISGERERQTFDLLRTTLLPARALVLGKLASALVFILLLLLLGLPLQSLSFLLGGVAPEEMLIASALLVATAFVFGAAGIFFSSLVRRTLAATVLTYSFALASTLGLPVILIPLAVVGIGLDTPRLIVQVIWIYTFGVLITTNPLATALATEIILIEKHTTLFFTETLYSSSGSSLTVPLVSPWLPYVLLALVLGALLIGISVLLVRRVER